MGAIWSINEYQGSEDENVVFFFQMCSRLIHSIPQPNMYRYVRYVLLCQVFQAQAGARQDRLGLSATVLDSCLCLA